MFRDKQGNKISCASCKYFKVDEDDPYYGYCDKSHGMFGDYTRGVDLCEKYNRKETNDA